MPLVEVIDGNDGSPKDEIIFGGVILGVSLLIEFVVFSGGATNLRLILCNTLGQGSLSYVGCVAISPVVGSRYICPDNSIADHFEQAL